jgi:HAD superfamily hydrolase (TIGR01509 family)
MIPRLRRMQLIIFDKDGTLYCGKELCERWTSGVLDGVRRVAPDLEQELETYLKKNVHEQTWSALQKRVEYELIMRGVDVDVASWMPKPLPQRLYPNVQTTLQALPCATALLTADSRRNTEYLLRRDNLYFDAVVCGDDFPGKPDPCGAWHILKTLGIAPEETVIVGDTEVDMQLKVTAGLGMSVGMTTLQKTLPGADIMINSVQELV